MERACCAPAAHSARSSRCKEAPTNVGSSLALDNSQFVLEARTGITIDAIYNPSANTETLLDTNEKLLSYFFTYGGQSAVTLQSTGGDVALNENSLNEQALLGSGARYR